MPQPSGGRVQKGSDMTEPKTCDQCGTPFEPRNGSGGKPQRFCSTECRLAFHAPANIPNVAQREEEKHWVPMVMQPQDIEAAPAASNFNWSSDDSIVLREQPAIAVYRNSIEGLTIRQERAWNEDEDTIVVIAPQGIAAFMAALSKVCGTP